MRSMATNSSTILRPSLSSAGFLGIVVVLRVVSQLFYNTIVSRLFFTLLFACRTKRDSCRQCLFDICTDVVSISIILMDNQSKFYVFYCSELLVMSAVEWHKVRGKLEKG